MNRVIIFDFNRTLYDPEAGRLAADCLRVLTELRQQGFLLGLIAQAAPSRRELIRNLGLEKLFTEIILSESKGKTDFERLLKRTGAKPEQSFVVGDRVRKEIAIGNRLGMRTIWVRQGRFAEELPRRTEEQPRETVSSLRQVLDTIR